MIIQTLAEYAEHNPFHEAEDDALAIALDMIREHRALILNLQAIQAAKLSLKTMIRALLMFSEGNQFIKYDPWDATIRVKQFPEAPAMALQYNPFRDPANRHADGQKAKTATGQLTDFLDWETFPESEHYLIWGAPSGRQYGILVQPAPIVPAHLIIASLDENPENGAHYPQVMRPFHLEDMHALQTALYPLGYAMGFNDRGAGASVDHFHTQAIPGQYLPLIRLYNSGHIQPALQQQSSRGVTLKVIAARKDYPVNALLLESPQVEALLDVKLALLAKLQEQKITMNTLGWETQGRRVEVFFPRAQEALMGNAFKAGYVEMGGMLVIPGKGLFESLLQPETGPNALAEAGMPDSAFAALIPDVQSLLK